MKRLLFLPVLAFAIRAIAQEPVPTEEAQRIAQKLREAVGQPSDAPFFVDTDTDHPKAIKSGEVGLMAVPDRKLSAQQIEAASKDVKDAIPVAQLWTLVATVAVDGKALAGDKLRTVTVGDGDDSKRVQLYFLGAVKDDAGALQLAIFAKDKAQPALRVPLRKIDPRSSTAPIEVAGRKVDESTGVLTLTFAGAYEAEIPLRKGE
jgi:hypothetical protein